MKAGIIVACLAGMLLVSCGTFPSGQLSVDFADETVPIMLSGVEAPGRTIALSFESGYRSLSVTTTSTYRGVSSSSTATVSTDLNRPLRDQLSNVLIQEPDWLLVSGLDLRTDLFLSAFVSTTSYVMNLDLAAPAKKQ